MINEPTAAGIAYGLQEQANETTYLIFDLGGGTFDVSILTMFSGIIEVRASSGDNFLGGIDFTKIIENMFLEFLKNNKTIPSKLTPKFLQKITEQAEIAKYKLSLEPENICMSVAFDSDLFEYTFSHSDFENWCSPLLQRLRDPIKKVLGDAKLTPSQIDQIILVGGASRMPVIKKLSAECLEDFHYVISILTQLWLKEQQYRLV